MIAKTWSVIQSNLSIFLVNNNNVVELNSNTCSCKMVFQKGFLCKKLCAVILFLGKDPNLYIEKYFLISNYTLFYKSSIFPITLEMLEKDNLLPPEEKQSKKD